MPKAFTLRKDFNRFQPSNRFNLISLQAFSFGLYNARLKLKKDKVRYNDMLTVMIIGEMYVCKISELKELLGYQTSTCQNAIKRAISRSLVEYYKGIKPGRGKPAKFVLTDKGRRVHQVLQNEVGKTLRDAQRIYFEFVERRTHM